MLPRLKRFADLLVGERAHGTALLGRVVRAKAKDPYRYQRLLLDLLGQEDGRTPVRGL